MPTEMRLAGKVALIAGATGGIGQAIAERFLAEGAEVALSGRRRRWSPPADASYSSADLRREPAVESMVQATLQRLGHIDVLVNAQGLDYHASLEQTRLAEAREVLEVNLLSAITTMKYVIPVMRHQGGGSIINLASRLGLVAIPGQAVYSASKGGLIMATRGAAIDHARDGIRVNAVALGMTNTEMIASWVASQPDPDAFRKRLEDSVPMGRLAEPQEIANAVLFLASDESSYVTGAVLSVDGGYTAA